MKHPLIKALYGNVAVLKAFCPKCGDYAFVLDGKLACCDLRLDEIPDAEKVKRETLGAPKRKRLPKKVRESILKRQGHRCIYCGVSFDDFYMRKRTGKIHKYKIHFDHFVSWNYSRNNHKDNFVAACNVCNLIKGDKYFPTMEETRKYILSKRHKHADVVDI